jgi:hypothetical protein
MEYVPNASDPTQPTEDKPVESAALEFRTLKPVLLRTLRFPASDPAGQQGELPTAANRAGKFLRFNSVTGVPEVAPGTPANPVTTADIEDEAVTTAKQADNSVTPVKLANGGRELGMRNMLINPRGGDVYQRTVAATADDVYFSDRWYALTQTGTVLPAVLSDPENGHPTGTRITQSQATAQRFGYAQIVEGKNCKDMRGSSVTFTPRVQVSGAQSLRYAILAHTGTEDLVTSDVVNNWTSSTFTAGNFFIAGLEIVAIGSATPVANTWTSLPLIAGIVPSSMNNLITFVWTESAQAQNFTLDYDFNQLEAGIVATPFDRRDYGRELIMCQRYYQIWFTGWAGVSAASGQYHSSAVGFKAEMRTTPTFGVVSQTNSGRFPSANYFVGIVNQYGGYVGYAAALSGGNDSWVVTGTASTEL